MPNRSTRSIIHSEGLSWLDENPATTGTSVITSLPDLSEMPHRDFERWKAWFIGAARRVLEWIPNDGAVIFYVSDTQHEGSWVDKGHWVSTAADQQNAVAVWHKIVCRKPAGSVGFGRASYTHMLCFAKTLPLPRPKPTPDVLPEAGFMPWSKAMGVAACVVACRFVKDEMASRVVVDPFCGSGTVLAVANALGLDAIGVDLSARRCRAAKRLIVEL